MKRPAPIVLSGAPPTPKLVAKHLGLSRKAQLRIEAQVAKLLQQAAAVQKSAQRSVSRLGAKRPVGV